MAPLAIVLLGFVPVVVFLVSLVALDGYALVRPRQVLVALATGAAAAGVAWLANAGATGWLPDLQPAWTRLFAPALEEILKGLAIVWLVRTHRVGFLVDAAIFGFAVGAGFALVENAYYVEILGATRPAVWVVRGLGTAVMHGGTTAIFAVVSKLLAERAGAARAVAFLPGLALAFAIHALFNQGWLSPFASSLAMLVILPLLLVVVFRQSERALRDWLGVGFDADAKLLELILSGRFTDSPVGRYLEQLTGKFPGEVVADMLCYLRLYTELALRAKGELMMRECGFKSVVEPETRAKLSEMKYLERSIGPTGRRALAPFLHVSGRTLWQLNMLDRS